MSPLPDNLPAPTLAELKMSHAELRDDLRQKSTEELRTLARPFREWSDDMSPERAFKVLRRAFAADELRARGES